MNKINYHNYFLALKNMMIIMLKKLKLCVMILYKKEIIRKNNNQCIYRELDNILWVFKNIDMKNGMIDYNN